MSYKFRLATKEDDQDLRDLFYASQMNDDGLFSLQYGREPSFLHGLEVEGSFSQVGIAVDESKIKAAACFTRTVRKLWVNGEPTNLGYIANCRIHPDFRNSALLFKGYSKLKELHKDGKSPLYLSTILEGNEDAQKMLTSGRAGLPVYHEIGRYTCHALVAGQDVKCDCKIPDNDADNDKSNQKCDFEIVQGCPELLHEIVDCLNRLGQRRQFAPYFTKDDFDEGNSLTRGLSLSDFLVARNETGVIGVMALWNQLSFKQLKVKRYGLLMKCVKAFWNTVMPVLGYGPLPAQGQDLSMFFISMVSVDSDNKDVFRALVSRQIFEAKEKGCLFAVIGLADNDPLTSYLNGFLKFGYRSRIYVVTHEGSEEEYNLLEEGVPWLDSAMI